MSTEGKSAPAKAAARPEHRPTGPQAGPHGPKPVEKAINFGPSLKRLVGQLRPERTLTIVVIGLSIIGVALSVVGPKVLGWATDVVFDGVLGTMMATMAPGASKESVVADLRAGGDDGLADLLANSTAVPGAGVDFERLAWLLAVTMALYLVSALFAWAQAFLLTGIVQRTVYRLRRDVEAKLNRLPLSYFDKQSRGEILSRVTNDIDNVSQSLQQTLSQLMNSLVTVIGVLVMMLIISPLLTLVALISIPVSMVLVAVIGKRSQVLFAQMWKSTGELNAHVEEAYTGHSLVKVFGRQREVEQVFAKRNEELYRAGFGSQFISGLIMPVMMFVGNLNYVLIAVLGGLRVISGSMTVGDVQAFTQYPRQSTQPLRQIASMANLMQSGVASAERVFEVLDETEQVPEGEGTLNPTLGEIRFEGVDFAYDPDKPLITDLTLTVEPGQTVAIVGPTGAGKTTLVNLVMRFYELDGGRITLDGVDISTVSRRALRENIGMVLQDTWLFGGTIRDNIAYGRPDATEEEIVAAATATYVDRFVHTLPDGYDTVIDDEGANISAGEKQLITIARAFLSDPALLILDEATSSVDTRTEALVQHAMSALRKDRTSFVIAHRLSTIRDADVILVMEEGQIVEQGSHAELLAAEGAYARLYQSQFTAPVS